jgi:hypothetical protein
MDITKKELKELKKLYNKALKEGKNGFIFNGQKVLTSYAKYLLEYLEGKFEETHVMDDKTYDKMNKTQKEMVDQGLDLINLFKEKEKIYEPEGFGVAGMLFFLPYQLEESEGGQIASSPGSVYFSADAENGLGIIADALTNFFLSDKQKFNLLQIINKNINYRIKQIENDKSKQKS